ncbi:hypothetical protein B0E47_00050 [Rhodanobacter sp. B05]|uniref:hypothetical protein n=1 Tax=Rhodanobacter sp. B05 TaxID=1945859 RepID=UPI000986CD94|nr:hypothetical protein [Rhodanobacter sp. B05]OOG61108.1 hypothetical protein B0E47_00050 [Rhodanobacter sp. B05]
MPTSQLAKAAIALSSKSTSIKRDEGSYPGLITSDPLFGAGGSASGGGYDKGMAVFTVTRGGRMYEASLAGQKFTYTATGR